MARMKCARRGDPDARKREPETEESGRQTVRIAIDEFNTKECTEIEIRDDMIVHPIFEVFTPFRASDEPVLYEL